MIFSVNKMVPKIFLDNFQEQIEPKIFWTQADSGTSGSRVHLGPKFISDNSEKKSQVEHFLLFNFTTPYFMMQIRIRKMELQLENGSIFVELIRYYNLSGERQM